MSKRFYDYELDGEKHYCFEDGNGLDIELNETNFLGNFHETINDDDEIRATEHAAYDWVGVLGHRDGEHYMFWRYEFKEHFVSLEYMCRRVGRSLIGSVALESTIDLFYNQFPEASRNPLELLREMVEPEDVEEIDDIIETRAEENPFTTASPPHSPLDPEGRRPDRPKEPESLPELTEKWEEEDIQDLLDTDTIPEEFFDEDA